VNLGGFSARLNLGTKSKCELIVVLIKSSLRKLTHYLDSRKKLKVKTELVIYWMSQEPITVTPDTRLIDADTILREYDIRRLPVVDNNGNLVGIVTLGDIREASASDVSSSDTWELDYLLAKLKIEKIMTPNPITVYTTDTIAEAARLMLENKVSGLPVVNPLDGILVGIITESDIFRLVVQTWDEAETEEVELVGRNKIRQ
jgi:CBS domain-containing protein